VCLLSDFGLAGWCSLSLGACHALRRIMPELAAADSGLGNSVWQLGFARIDWRRRRRAALEQPGRRRQHPDHNTAVRVLRAAVIAPACARSDFRAGLYPLAAVW
jgi:hypothetical protein